MNWKGLGRKQLWSETGTIPAIAWGHRGKSRKPSVRIPGNPAKIRTQNPLNTYLSMKQIAEELFCSKADQTVISTSYNAITSE
jgi:hypothetical protein